MWVLLNQVKKFKLSYITKCHFVTLSVCEICTYWDADASKKNKGRRFNKLFYINTVEYGKSPLDFEISKLIFCQKSQWLVHYNVLLFDHLQMYTYPHGIAPTSTSSWKIALFSIYPATHPPTPKKYFKL